MPTYRVIRKSDGAEVYCYTNDTPIEWGAFPVAEFDSVAVPEVVAPEVVAPPQVVKITKLAFRNRFTPTEKVTIEMASADNPAATLQQRQLSASLRATLADQRDASHIDISQGTASGLQTRAGVQALEALGLIAPGRAAAILDTPPAAHEVFNG